jgi:hypothetical protein
MVQMSPEKLKNYFRYEGSIERQYYRAIAALEKAQAARLRREQHLERTLRNAPPDTIAETSPEPPPPNVPAEPLSENGIGFVQSQPHASGETATAAPLFAQPLQILMPADDPCSYGNGEQEAAPS